MGTREIAPELAREIESLGYGAVWIGASPEAELAWVEPALEQTSALQMATGIVNIWTAPAAAVAKSYHLIEETHQGRFLLGVGVGHPEATQEYQKPCDALVSYLDELDSGFQGPGSARLIDAVVAYGTPDAIARRLNEHWDAGADHVAVQVLGSSRPKKLLPVLTELAGALGLTG